MENQPLPIERTRLQTYVKMVCGYAVYKFHYNYMFRKSPKWLSKMPQNFFQIRTQCSLIHTGTVMKQEWSFASSSLYRKLMRAARLMDEITSYFILSSTYALHKILGAHHSILKILSWFFNILPKIQAINRINVVCSHEKITEWLGSALFRLKCQNHSRMVWMSTICIVLIQSIFSHHNSRRPGLQCSH